MANTKSEQVQPSSQLFSSFLLAVSVILFGMGMVGAIVPASSFDGQLILGFLLGVTFLLGGLGIRFHSTDAI